MKLPGNTALTAIRQELAKASPDTDRIKALMPSVKRRTMDSQTFDQVAALYAAEMTAAHPTTLPTE